MTTQTKHTAGPWTLIVHPFTDSDGGIDLKGNCGNTLIANFPTLEKIEGVAYTPSEEDAANLVLIAAAPELYAELEKLAAWLERSENPRNLRYAAEARSALAKATI